MDKKYWVIYDQTMSHIYYATDEKMDTDYFDCSISDPFDTFAEAKKELLEWSREHRDEWNYLIKAIKKVKRKDFGG